MWRRTGSQICVRPALAGALVACWLVVGAGHARRACGAEAPGIGAAADDHYAGRTAEEWRLWFQDFELSGSRAAAAASEVAALAVERRAPAPLRRQATLTLGRIRPVTEAAVPVIERLLNETEPCETDDLPRSWALKSIALLDGPAAPLTPQIVQILNDPATSVLDRLLCLEALARIGPNHPETLAPVVRALERGIPAESIVPEELERASADLQFRRVAADVLSLFGPAASPAVPALLEAAREDDELLRRAAVATLGSTKSPIVLEALTDILLFDPSPAVQDAAAVAASQLGVAAVGRLRSLLDDSDPTIQVRAIDALRRIGPPAKESTPQLARRLNAASPEVCVAAAEAYWAITNEPDPALETAVQSLAASERTVRMRAHRLILAIGRTTQDLNVLARLQTAAESRNPRVRQAAYIALRELQRELQPVP